MFKPIKEVHVGDKVVLGANARAIIRDCPDGPWIVESFSESRSMGKLYRLVHHSTSGDMWFRCCRVDFAVL